jgi:hypothetical protein
LKSFTTFRNRIITLVGVSCLGMSLALLPAGVNVVRADDGAEKLMSVDPLLVAGDPVMPRPPPVGSVPMPAEGVDGNPSKVSSGEVPAGPIVLNTRGYNYGPPPAAIDPAAMRLEGRKP